jgi:hypothetical protein
MLRSQAALLLTNAIGPRPDLRCFSGNGLEFKKRRKPNAIITIMNFIKLLISVPPSSSAGYVTKVFAITPSQANPRDRPKTLMRSSQASGRRHHLDLGETEKNAHRLDESYQRLGAILFLDIDHVTVMIICREKRYSNGIDDAMRLVMIGTFADRNIYRRPAIVRFCGDPVQRQTIGKNLIADVVLQDLDFRHPLESSFAQTFKKSRPILFVNFEVHFCFLPSSRRSTKDSPAASPTVFSS